MPHGAAQVLVIDTSNDQAPWLCSGDAMGKSSKGMALETASLSTQTLLGLPMEDPHPSLDTPEGVWGLKTWRFEGPR